MSCPPVAADGLASPTATVVRAGGCPCDALTAELKKGGFTVRHWWTDPAARYALVVAVPNQENTSPPRMVSLTVPGH